MAEAIAFDMAGGVINKLSSLALQQIAWWWNLKDDVDDLKRFVSSIKAVVLDAEDKSATSHAVKDWLQNLKDVLFDADDLLDDFSTEALRQDLMGGNKLINKVRVFFSSSNQFAYGLKMGCQIRAIKAKLNSIKSDIEILKLVDRGRPADTPFMTKRREQGHSFVTKGEIIGREDDKKALLQLILSESEENLLIIPIVGMGGLGKTALAQLVYNDDSVKKHFELRMWECVSDVFDVKVIVENIIKSATDKTPDQNLQLDQLQKLLRDNIDGRKYLLVLDDIWNEEREKWFSLKKLLMGGARGSRIIVTTRSQRVAKVTSACPPYVLRGLSDDDARNLFKEIAFEQRPADSKKPSFVEIGKKVLEKCGGVPLVIRTIAGTLSYKETENEWVSFEDNELARVSQREGDILPTLKLSYDHLPSPLKHCFAYCRLYPKDHVIHVESLIQLWIAQGFVEHSKNSNQSIEDIGFGYFKELVERSFFQEVEEKFGDMMSCKMHDLMHDVAVLVAGAGSIILDSNTSASGIIEKCRHVSIDFSLIQSHGGISIPFFRVKNLRTIRLRGGQHMSNEACSSIISTCRCLRALELRAFNLNEVPSSIRKLKHLRHLDLSQNDDLRILPNSICKLPNLRVLKLDCCYGLKKLPENIGKLVNLTHLGLDECFCLTHRPRGIGKLTSLQTLSRFVVDKDGSHGADLSELGGLNNLKGELRITNLGYVKNAKKKFQAANLKEKAHLQSLILEWGRHEDDGKKSLEDLQPHPNLKQLFVDGWRGDANFPSWVSSLSNLSRIEIGGPSKFKHLRTFHQLPHLEKLCIEGLSKLEYMDHNLAAEGGHGESELFFPSLKKLHLLQCPKLKSWWRSINDEDGTTTATTTSRAFPRLSSLQIEDCPLTSMPLYPSLQEGLILKNCSSRPLLRTMQMKMQANTNTIPSFLPLSKLKSLEVENVEVLDVNMLKECLRINLTSLESLSISSCHWMKSLFGSLQHLTSLKNLTIRDSEELDLDGTQLESLRNLSYLKITNMRRLVSLPKLLQPLIGLKNLIIWNCRRLRSFFPLFAHLRSLQSLVIDGCEDEELDLDGSQYEALRNLSSLEIENMARLISLPSWLQHLTNLRRLRLYDLPSLRKLPEEMRHLTNLEELIIYKVPQLSERCRKDIGADWPKIAHIPSIEIDLRTIQ